MAAEDQPSADPRIDPDATRLLLHADPPSRLPRGTRLREFEVDAVVGEGGFSIVYAAVDLNLRRRVALKEYMPAALALRCDDRTVRPRSANDSETFELGRRSFINEARLLAQFDHPALVKVHQFWEANGTAYMVMPLYEGWTLKQWVKERNGPPTEEELIRIVAPLLDALEHLHAERVFHRDIAPDNVLLLDDNRPVLLDFGAARQVLADSNKALTAILKVSYAPIEQYADMSQLRQGPWTDVYAFCGVLYFAMTGAAPPSAVARSINDKMVPAVKAAAGRYSMRFLRGIDSGLAVRPEERPQSIGQLRDLLLPVVPATIGGGATNSQKPSAGIEPVTVSRDIRSAVVIGIAGLLGLTIVGGWLASRGHDSDGTTWPRAVDSERGTLVAPTAPAPRLEPLAVPEVTKSSAPSPASNGPILVPASPVEEPVAAGRARAAPSDSAQKAATASVRDPAQRSEAARVEASAAESRRAGSSLRVEREGAARSAPDPSVRARCLQILQRMQLGELPSTEEKSYLQKECT